MKNYKFNLSGLKCLDCKKTVQRAFLEDDNVLKVKVSDDLNFLELKTKEAVSFREIKRFFILKFDGKYSLSKNKFAFSSYLFLLSIIVLLLIESYFLALLINIPFMNAYMGSYLFVFGVFKLIDLKGFVESFRMYDPLAQKFLNYAKLYPFLEILFAASYFYSPSKLVNIVVSIIFAINTFGVVSVLKSKSEIRCACSGTFFRLNLSFLTLVENFLMIGMSLYMIFN